MVPCPPFESTRARPLLARRHAGYGIAVGKVKLLELQVASMLPPLPWGTTEGTHSLKSKIP